jgi:hypothetical protein
MISLCLQACPLDMEAAIELTQLICEIEPERRPDTEFFLVYRKDCPLDFPRYFAFLAGQKFGRVRACMARNHDEGHAGGCNMLAASAFIEMTLLLREGICQHTGFLLFEPDCVPVTRDWIDRLSAEWDRVSALGKEAFGHWHQQGGPDTLHMNGNAVFRTTFFDEHPTTIVGPQGIGWDYFFRDRFIPMSCDSNLIFQLYNTYGLSHSAFASLNKNGVRPAFLHGVKDGSARQHARTFLLHPEQIEANL